MSKSYFKEDSYTKICLEMYADRFFVLKIWEVISVATINSPLTAAFDNFSAVVGLAAFDNHPPPASDFYFAVSATNA